MSYADQQALSADGEFHGRLWACLATEGRGKPDDPLSIYFMPDPFRGVQLFIPFVATAPGFDAKYTEGGQSAITDGDLLAAVQAAWPDVAVPT